MGQGVPTIAPGRPDFNRLPVVGAEIDMDATAILSDPGEAFLRAPQW